MKHNNTVASHEGLVAGARIHLFDLEDLHKVGSLGISVRICQ